MLLNVSHKMSFLVKDMARTLWGISPPCDLDESWCTYRSLHAEQKSPWPRSRRTHRLTYRGHQRSHYRGMGRTLWENCPRAIWMKIGVLIDLCMLNKSLRGPEVVGPTV